MHQKAIANPLIIKAPKNLCRRVYRWISLDFLAFDMNSPYEGGSCNFRLLVFCGSYEFRWSYVSFYRRLLLADPVIRPDLSRKVILLPVSDADPLERPRASRKLV